MVGVIVICHTINKGLRYAMMLFFDISIRVKIRLWLGCTLT